MWCDNDDDYYGGDDDDDDNYYGDRGKDDFHLRQLLDRVQKGIYDCLQSWRKEQ